MNVVILQKYLTPYRLPLFNALAEQKDIHLTVLLYGRPEMRRKWEAFEGEEFAVKQVRCLAFPVSYEKNFSFPFSLLSELYSIAPDLIICAPDFGGIAALLYIRTKSACYTIWSESTQITDGSGSWLRRKLRAFIYSMSTGFIVPGLLSERYIRSFIPAAQVSFANNCVNDSQFSLSASQVSDKFEKKVLNITFSGSLVMRKGILHLLDAFKRLNQDQPALAATCRLRVLGAGTLDLTEYQSANVSLVGFLQNEQYFTFIKESHLFILPSLSDCNPLTVVEALLAGNVLVLSDKVGNYPEAIQGNGVVVPSHSVDTIYSALVDLLRLPRQELLSMANCSLKVSDKFSTANSIQGFLKAIEAAGVR